MTYTCGSGSGTAPAAETNIASGTPITLAYNSGCTNGTQTFTGWSCGASGASITVTSNTTCSAQWSGGGTTYTTTFDCGPGQAKPGTSLPVYEYNAEGTDVTCPNGADFCNANNGGNFSYWACSNITTPRNAGVTFATGGKNITCSARYIIPNACANILGTGNKTGDATCTQVSPNGTQGGCAAEGCRCGYDSYVYIPYEGRVDCSATPPSNTDPTPAASYTITYNCNGGSGTAPDATSFLSSASSVTLAGVGSCYKGGSTFVGWEYNNNTYTAGGTMSSPGQSITMLAHWAENVESNSDCSATTADADGTWMGCVAPGFSCKTNYVTSGGNCVNPCSLVSVSGGASPTSSCADFNGVTAGVLNGCVAKHCQCSSGARSYPGPTCMANVEVDGGCTVGNSAGTNDWLWEGCVQAGLRCANQYVAHNGSCVDPCANVTPAETFMASQSCTGFNEADGGCAKQYCKCITGYTPVQDGHVADHVACEPTGGNSGLLSCPAGSDVVIEGTGDFAGDYSHCKCRTGYSPNIIMNECCYGSC